MKCRKVLIVLTTILVFVSCIPAKKKNAHDDDSIFFAQGPTKVNGFQLEQEPQSGVLIDDLGDREIIPRNFFPYHGGLILCGGFYVQNDDWRDKNDVLFSRDGREWLMLTDKVFEPERVFYSAGMYRDKVVFVGGIDIVLGSINLNDYRKDAFAVVSATTGKVENIKGLSPVLSPPLLVEFKEYLLVIGGFRGKDNSIFRIRGNKVVDEITIEEMKKGHGIDASVQAWVIKNTAYIADSDGCYWKSNDAKIWEPYVSRQQIEMERYGSTVIATETVWYLIGGYYRQAQFDMQGTCNDVWKSTDEGKTWVQISQWCSSDDFPVREASLEYGHHRTFPAREGCAGFALNGKLIVAGGKNAEGNLQDIWESDDGVTWRQLFPKANS